MARKVDNWPADTKYPWDEWLDGDIWELIPDEDFKVRLASFKNAAYQMAHRRGLDVEIRIKNGKVYLQARGHGND